MQQSYWISFVHKLVIFFRKLQRVFYKIVHYLATSQHCQCNTKKYVNNHLMMEKKGYVRNLLHSNIRIKHLQNCNGGHRNNFFDHKLLLTEMIATKTMKTLIVMLWETRPQKGYLALFYMDPLGSLISRLTVKKYFMHPSKICFT